MLELLIGLLFGFIFGWLWRNWQETRRAPRAAEQYNRQPAPVAVPAAEAADSAELQRLRAQLAASEKQAHTLQATVETQTTELKSLKAQLDRLGSRQDVKTEEFNAMKAEQTRLRERLAAHDKTVEELQAKLAQRTEALTKAEADNAAKAGLLQSLQRELEDLRSSHSERRA